MIKFYVVTVNRKKNYSRSAVAFVALERLKDGMRLTEVNIYGWVLAFSTYPEDKKPKIPWMVRRVYVQ